jgi:hypothetical protein
VSLVVLDTDVASASLRSRLPDQLRAALAGHTMCITFVTVGELVKWRVLRSWGQTALQTWPDGASMSQSSDMTKRSRRNGASSKPARYGADGPGLTTTPGSPPAA